MSKIDWPASICDSPAAAVLSTSLQKGKLGHGLLFVGEDIVTLDAAAEALAKAILGSYPHADATKAEPAGKLRQIGVEAMREVRTFLQTSSLGASKVAIISCSDRLNKESANLFLKSLEEPPEGSFIILTSTEPHAILPTLLSRVMRFRLSSPAQTVDVYRQVAQTIEKHILAGHPRDTLADYGLLNNLHPLWNTLPESPLPSDQTPPSDDETSEAREAMLIRAHRGRFLAALQEGFLNAFKKHPTQADRLVSALKAIERAKKMMIFSLNEAAVLELAVAQSLEEFNQ